MKQLRNHWAAATVVVGFLGVLAIVAWRASNTATAAVAVALVQDPPVSLTAIERDEISSILAEVTLDRDALIGLNLSSTQCDSVLTSVSSWHQTNAATMRSLRASVDVDKVAVRSLEKATASGPHDSGRASALALARADLKTSQAAYANAFTSLHTSVNAVLTISQRQAWAALATGKGQPMPWRLLSQTDDQRVAINRTLRHHRYRRASAKGKSELDAAATTRQSELDATLTTEQKNIVSSYYTNYDNASQVVNTRMSDLLAVEEG